MNQSPGEGLLARISHSNSHQKTGLAGGQSPAILHQPLSVPLRHSPTRGPEMPQ